MSIGRALIIGVLLCLRAGSALADSTQCSQGSMPVASLDGLAQAAQRQGADALDLESLEYCSDRKNELVTVDIVPVPAPGGSLDAGWLTCSRLVAQRRDWNCLAQRFQAIRLPSGADRREVTVQVYDGAIEATRQRAGQAFALLDEATRIEHCPKNLAPALSINSLRAVFERQNGPYRLYEVPEGYDLVRGAIHARIVNSTTDRPAHIACWDQDILEE